MINTISLKEAFERNTRDEQFLLKKIEVSNEKQNYIGHFEHANLIFATYFMYEEGDFIKARNCFYKCAVTAMYMHEIYNENIYSSTRHFCYAILSDHVGVIERYKQFDDNFLDTFGSSFGKAIQAVYKNDNALLKRQLKLMENNTKEGWEKYFAGAFNTFKGILERDSFQIEKGISQLLFDNSQQNNPALVKSFFNIEGTALAKLAKFIGLEIGIENTLLPKKILPILELQSYEGYEFFKQVGL